MFRLLILFAIIKENTLCLASIEPTLLQHKYGYKKKNIISYTIYLMVSVFVIHSYNGKRAQFMLLYKNGMEA